jgi:hypothetical protein
MDIHRLPEYDATVFGAPPVASIAGNLVSRRNRTDGPVFTKEPEYEPPLGNGRNVHV